MENILANLKKPIQNNSVYQFASVRYNRWQRLKRYTREAKRLRDQAANINDIHELISLQKTSNIFLSGQINTEIHQLLSLLHKRRPVTIMEIGTRKGGTLFLFSQVCQIEVKIISLDYQYPSVELKKSLKHLAKHGQQIIVIEGDSHEAKTFHKVKSVLQGDLLDFLFIDGDHSYDGVKKDFELFSNLVKVGGIIAFHDIVPDYFTQYGQKTASNVGQVPRFWEELKSQVAETIEFVGNKNQDGYGIGVITKS